MMSVFRPLGPRFVPAPVEVGSEGPGPCTKLLELLLTLLVGLDGVMLDTELDRSLDIRSQSSHSQAFDNRRSIMFLRDSDCCSASSLYCTWEHILRRERFWNMLNCVIESRLRASC